MFQSSIAQPVSELYTRRSYRLIGHLKGYKALVTLRMCDVWLMNSRPKNDGNLTKFSGELMNTPIISAVRRPTSTVLMSACRELNVLLFGVYNVLIAL